MQASQNGIELIKKFEGFRSKPYLCAGGVATIGYGSTRYADGSIVALSDEAISEGEAENLLMDTLTPYERAVSDMVKVDLNQNQFDALVSFAYNLGVGSLKKSTLLKRINSSSFNAAALEFAQWSKAGGKTLDGLVKRRAAEAELFLA